MTGVGTIVSIVGGAAEGTTSEAVAAAPEPALLAAVNTAVWLTGADTAGLLIADERGETATVCACAGRWTVHSANLRVRSGHGLSGRIMQTRRPWKVDDYDSDRSIDFSDVRSAIAADGTRAGLGAPVLAGDRLLGVLMVWSRRPAAFQVDATQTLVSLAELVTAVLVRDQQVDEARHEVARLQELDDAVAAARARQLGYVMPARLRVVVLPIAGQPGSRPIGTERVS